MKLHDERRDYEQAQLRRSDLDSNPFQQFALWFTQAQQRGDLPDPTAFTLATVGTDGQPHQRIVLLKQVDEQGFLFFTNYQSQKGQDIAANAKVSMHFAWLSLERQVRIEGHAERLPAALSADYFSQRPRGSQLGAWCSSQSEVIASRNDLEARYHALERDYEGKTIDKPEHWGGYRIIPQCFEFWQGGRYRLHDRFRYQRQADTWQIDRLQP